MVDNGDTIESLVERLGRTKRLILIELTKGAAGYKKLSKKLRIGLDTIRSHIKTGKHSNSLTQLGLIQQEERGWSITESGTKVLEILKKDPEYSPFFVEAPSTEKEDYEE